MSKNKLIKLIISALVLVLFIVFSAHIVLDDGNIIGIKTSSIKTLLGLDKKIETATKKYSTEKDRYNQTVKSIETAKEEYNKEKAKYDAISEETLEGIRQAIKKEEYNIEYMWIRLGNYAKTNNLSIVLVEPGGSAQTETPADNNTSSSTTTTTSSSTEAEQKSQENKIPATKTATSTALKVQITGNYLNISNFIYEVESDTELRFKLDNISMEYVGNNNIKSTFDVKNLIMLKK